MILSLRRESLSPVTLGILSMDGEYFGLTLERPWKDNAQAVSCIPAGKYKLDLTPSPKFGRRMLEVLNVPGRLGIRIHAANTVDQLKGCIAVGKRVKGERLEGTLVPDLMEACRVALASGDGVTLEITDP